MDGTMDMARTVHRLTAVGVNRLKEAGIYSDGGNLNFRVAPGGSRSWVFRFAMNGKTRDAGLGPYPEVSLSEARVKAFEWRKLLVAGVDPLAQRNAERASNLVAASKSMTFDDCVAGYIAAHESAWRSLKHGKGMRATLTAYAFPVFGRLPVSAIDTGLVMRVLEPIWAIKPTTASRLRGRIENVLDWAKVRGYRQGENPARWKGHLDHLLPSKSKVQAIEHHLALPYAEIGAFMAELRRRQNISARALEFLILTAGRRGEVIGARWSEIDLPGKVWTIPASRMKASREHRVPLTSAAVAVLKQMEAIRQSDFVFPGMGGGRIGINAMHELLGAMGWRDAAKAHGFRSTFRDWAAERTSFPRELAELSLAHSVGNEVEQAYRRTDMFEKRRKLMDAWAEFCAKPSAGKVVALALARTPR
jgi:integrase